MTYQEELKIKIEALKDVINIAKMTDTEDYKVIVESHLEILTNALNNLDVGN